MCGIVAYVGVREAAPILFGGLTRLEYRGYDSSGMAVQGENGIQVIRAVGDVSCLARRADEGRALRGACGIGHTRWATHGAPDEANAHPQVSPGRRVAVVHNGVIENHRALRSDLEEKGYRFASQTDTEAAALLLDWHYAQRSGEAPRMRALHAIGDMARRLRGSFALAVLFADQPDAVYAAKRESPLLIGRCEEGGEGTLLASDETVLLPYTRRVMELGDMEIARLDRGGVQVYNIDGESVEKPVRMAAWKPDAAEKGGYAHFMLKEIMEQPRAVRDTISPRICRDASGRLAADLSADGLSADRLRGVRRVLLIGCGSAYHAGLVGRAVTERLAKTPAACEMASEFCCRPFMEANGTLAVVISQSGETADSLSALRLCRERGVRTLAVVNAAGSSLAREADAVMLTHAGPEISVATTKAYSAQLACLYLLAAALAQAKGTMEEDRRAQILRDLLALPEKIGQVLRCEEQAKRLAERLHACRDAFFIGRGVDYAACMEGSLKLKEISYIHAEAYAAGELKHGSISLIEPGTPVIACATQPDVLDKEIANMEEAAARGARLLAIAFEGEEAAAQAADETICLPRTDALLSASLTAIPMQLLAYHVSCGRGLNVDKPRNLAKSVTVE